MQPRPVMERGQSEGGHGRAKIGAADANIDHVSDRTTLPLEASVAHLFGNPNFRFVQHDVTNFVHVEGDLFFGAAELFRTQVQRIVLDPNLKVIILRMKNARHLDATSVLALDDLIKFVRSKGRHILVSGATRDVYKVLKNSGVLETLQSGCVRKEGETNLFLYHPSNPNISTRDALLRAQELLGTRQAEIKIYYDPQHEKKDG